MEPKSKAVKVAFSGRDTGKGARTTYQVYSLKQQKLLNPAYRDKSKTGNHWTDYYWLYPAKYLIVYQDISNAGNHHCGCAIIQVKPTDTSNMVPYTAEKYANTGEWSILQNVRMPNWASPLCRCQIPQPQE